MIMIVAAEKLIIEITLGNTAMQSAADASRAITFALTREVTLFDPLEVGQGGTIRDSNGEAVGKWEATTSSLPQADTMNIWQAFTDGASSPDGRGGWAYVIVKDA